MNARRGVEIIALLLAGCSDNPGSPCSLDCQTREGVIVSNAVAPGALTAETGDALALAPGAVDDVAYVSLVPGTVPAGSRASVRRVGNAGSVTTAVTDGGFDPVPVPAQVGDSIVVVVTDAAGAVVLQQLVLVAAARRPIVVRTDPPPRKRDVPLNASVVIVFSEPMNASTLNASSVQLLRGTTPVAGTVSLLQGSATAAVFTPDALLDANTDYQLVVSQAVRDLDGDALAAETSVEFTTGTVLVGSVASVWVVPDSVEVLVGTQFQLTAVATDAQGMPVTGRPITWTSGDPSVATVSATGLVTARAEGYLSIGAEIEGQRGWVTLSVRAELIPVRSVTVMPESARMAVGYTLQLEAEIRDTTDAIIQLPRPIAWTSSDQTVATVAPYYSRSAIVTGVRGGSARIFATVEGKSDTAVVTVVAGPGSVVVAPTPASVTASDTIMLTATVRDAADNLVDYPSVTWTSSAPGVATVVADGAEGAGLAFATVTGVSPGVATITATSGAASGTASVTVTPPRAVASVTVTPGAAALLLHESVVLTATLRDAQGQLIERRPVTWESDNPSAATVDAGGLVTGVGAGSASVSATAEGVSDTAAITVTSLRFVSVSAGGYRWETAAGFGVSARTCAVTTAGAAYCWGGSFATNIRGQGSTNSILVPAAVAGGHTFSMVSVGGNGYTCGVTPEGAAYCWGSIPVAVTGGLIFSAVTVGSGHACGLAPAGAAYCWGSNGSGQLGDGSTTSSSVPVLVAGGLTFSALSASGEHTCGLATTGAAYCWGLNSSGQLGDGSTSSSAVPVPVALTGGVTFSALSASGEHTCGLASTGAAYCWGLNRSGQLGDGSTSSSSVPVAVAGGLTFATLARGAAPEVPPMGSLPVHTSEHTCGVITSGAAYCWGNNGFGQLGTGSTTYSTVPVAVAGGLTFFALSASGVHTCGLTTDGVAYCWGDNRAGQLGTGTTSSSNVPVKVVGQS